MTFPIDSNKSHHLFSFSFNELFDEKVSLICQGKEIILAKIDQGTIVIKAAGKDHINYTRIDKGTYMIYIYNPLLNKTQTNLTINSNERFQAFSLNDKSINDIVLGIRRLQIVGLIQQAARWGFAVVQILPSFHKCHRVSLTCAPKPFFVTLKLIPLSLKYWVTSIGTTFLFSSFKAL